jgi:acetoin utilization deacetylase AcuC-like enzyme
MLMIAFDRVYVLPLPSDHRFPMAKYELIPQQLLYEGIIQPEQLFAPKRCQLDDVLLAHDRSYTTSMLNLELSDRDMRKIGFPLTQTLIDREFVIAGGTVQCSEYALLHGASLNIAGGTHHAYRDRGEGFCLLNDVAVAASVLLHRGAVGQILVVDLDVHQGQGTAKIFEEDSRVFTFSMHGKNNYPLHKERSDLDVELEDGTTGDEYLFLLADHLPKLLERIKPDIVFYISGVDVLSTDRYGKLKLSLDECYRRDESVFALMKFHHIPIVTVMGGGYSRELRLIVDAHVNTFRAAMAFYG